VNGSYVLEVQMCIAEWLALAWFMGETLIPVRVEMLGPIAGCLGMW
jgi:hypothetical protein